jgi:hypothetical protein
MRSRTALVTLILAATAGVLARHFAIGSWSAAAEVIAKPMGRQPLALRPRSRGPSETAACSTTCGLPETTNLMRQSLSFFTQPVVSKTLTTDNRLGSLIRHSFEVGEAKPGAAPE